MLFQSEACDAACVSEAPSPMRLPSAGLPEAEGFNRKLGLIAVQTTIRSWPPQTTCNRAGFTVTPKRIGLQSECFLVEQPLVAGWRRWRQTWDSALRSTRDCLRETLASLRREDGALHQSAARGAAHLCLRLFEPDRSPVSCETSTAHQEGTKCRLASCPPRVVPR